MNTIQATVRGGRLEAGGGGTPHMTEAPLSDRIHRMYRMPVVFLL
jgi:hypothetical protein